MVSDKEIEDLLTVMKKEGFSCWLATDKEKEFSEKTKEESK